MLSIKLLFCWSVVPLLVCAIPAQSPLLAPSTWVHPGYVVDKAQLDFSKKQVGSKSQPWSNAYDKMLTDSDKYGKYATATRNSKATATVKCGPTTKPDIGCTDERGDALAAWANALAGYISGDSTFTKNAVELMNKWSHTIKGHDLQNAILQTAWAGASWARAGELVRHTTTGIWADSDIKQFESMLRDVYLPACLNGDTRASNWDMACLNTAIGIAVFLEDSSVYNHAMGLFQEAVPSVIYLESDGKLPHAPRGGKSDEASLKSHWFNQQTWGNKGQSGQIQETCRDLTHTGYSISSISHILETSRIQGHDQYKTEIGTRLQYALGFHTQFENGVKSPEWLCQGKALERKLEYVTEIGYNALATRGNVEMKQTQQYTVKMRPQGTNGLFYGWETLTHAENTA